MAELIPPGPKAHWLLGNLLEFRRDPLAFLTGCAQTYGEVTRFHILRTPVYLLTNPEHIELVLTSKGRSFVKGRSIRALYPLLGQGLFTSEGDRWLRLRRLNQQAFKPSKLPMFAQAVLECTNRMLTNWRANAEVDIYAAMNDLTVRIVAMALFSIDMEREAAEVCGALHSILEQFRAQLDTAMLIPASIPTPSNLRMRRGLNRLEKVVEHIIEKRRKMSARPDDLLSALMYPEDPSSALSDRELRDEVITFLVAGHETTAVALTWAWYLLSNHPEANSRLLREIETQIGERSVCLDDLPVLHYARVVLLETLRLFPPAWTTPRRATEEVTIGSYVLPVGASVTMPQWVVHRDPRFFANPGSFIPERWLDNTIERLPRYAYFPFGGGRRGCIGEPFAMVEAVLILIAIAQRFRVQLKPGQEIKPWPTLTLHPDRAVKVHLKPRTSCAGNSQPV